MLRELHKQCSGWMARLDQRLWKAYCEEYVNYSRQISSDIPAIPPNIHHLFLNEPTSYFAYPWTL